ncbi:MAG TPA: hypothetical protein VN520_30535 [Streptomyces sp.]|uniref:hypothetical protein n=1 Tax=Streptomyces sp. TaxID=1931 RepID=UPI002C0B5791|nr:hypothetical protein [Streptomyces sp.]HWU10649.1 hypothetical protein [Streptomyces sp.]
MIVSDVSTARELAGGRVIVVFEPCGSTRVRVLGTRRGVVLADEVVLLPVRDAVPSTAGPAARDEVEEAAVGAGAHVCWVGGLAQAADAVAAHSPRRVTWS